MNPIVVDANVFLRFFVRPATPEDAANASSAASLFGQAEEGSISFTSNSAVIAEVVFILTSKFHYGLSREDAVLKLLPLLALPACHVPQRDRLIRALTRWKDSAKLSFVDALVVEQSSDEEAELASFDRQVRNVPGVAVWQEA